MALRRLIDLAAWRADVVLVAVTVTAAVVGMQLAVNMLLPSLPAGPGNGPLGPGELGIVVDEGAGLLSGGEAGLSLQVRGEVSGLYPGAELALPMVIDNASGSPLVISRVDVVVGTPSRPGCPAGSLLVGPGRGAGQGSLSTEVSVAPGSSGAVAVPLAMARQAPSACQGATFPLQYRAHGIVP